MDCIVLGVTKNRTQLSNFHFHFSAGKKAIKVLFKLTACLSKSILNPNSLLDHFLLNIPINLFKGLHVEKLEISAAQSVRKGMEKNISTFRTIDTVNFAKQQTYTVGSYPNGLALLGDNIFVTNSDYGNGMKPSLSKIDLKSGNVSEIKDAAITNPMEILTAGDAVYFLDYGTYEAGTWKQVGAGVRKVTLDGKVTKVVDGTAMGSDGKKIYTANAPYLGDGINYFIYDIATGTSKTWEPADIFSPAMIVADPVTGNVFIVSYQNNGGWAAYDLPTYTNQYDAAGNFVKKYENTATGAISAVFNTHTEYVKQ